MKDYINERIIKEIELEVEEKELKRKTKKIFKYMEKMVN